ncbi:toll/interleukin-1 receptor domain-containing protein [Altibacter sp.]|uniref:toll/interleukin-1 receptor domain-containing protein n=1 Tax=Altibacter sp. TaxID=2024823 RepID=UPI00258E69D2|nr:toll/interleukin-1 receptor domain-containing protein [Altibacter sp.]MCW9038356.1 toll/interleukin-1 receptor domain-containing protein [Altibacter sp.]
MNKHHVFFSYSRENSDFVLELAKKLRNAGAQVWLDQLDIKTGERWDRSIEQALSASDVLMVVLSKASVESNNVMDEVSYALEEGKKVLPILLEECDVPFRLRRLQFADFSQNPEDGMKVLIAALDLDRDKVAPVAEGSTLAKTQKTTGASKTADPIIATPSPEPNAPIHRGATPSAAASRKPFLYIGIVLLTVAAIWAVYHFTSGQGKDKMALCKSDWTELETEMSGGEDFNELAALRRHIELYAPCPHQDEAMDRISFLKAMGGDAGTTTTIDTVDAATPAASTTSGEGTSNGSTTNEKSQTATKNKPADVVETVVKTQPLTGRNVTRVAYDGGYFQELSATEWVEINNDNERIFKLLKRDDTTIYLGEGPDVRLTLDLGRSTIYYADANTERFHLYTITTVSGKEN